MTAKVARDKFTEVNHCSKAKTINCSNRHGSGSMRWRNRCFGGTPVNRCLGAKTRHFQHHHKVRLKTQGPCAVPLCPSTQSPVTDHYTCSNTAHPFWVHASIHSSSQQPKKVVKERRRLERKWQQQKTLVSQPRNACVQIATETLTLHTGWTKVLTAWLFRRCFSVLPGWREMGYRPTLHFALTLPTPDTRICTHRCTISIWPWCTLIKKTRTTWVVWYNPPYTFPGDTNRMCAGEVWIWVRLINCDLDQTFGLCTACTLIGSKRNGAFASTQYEQVARQSPFWSC